MSGENDADQPLTARDRAILAAVAGGGAELVWGVVPDLYLDGRCCSDQTAAYRLVQRGLIAPVAVCQVGRRIAAKVTTSGQAHLPEVRATA